MLIKVDWNSKKSLKEAVAPKLNDNFWKWFGNSKVVDEQGKPLVVYHGSSKLFNTFKQMKSKSGQLGADLGFWFSDNENIAKRFSNNSFVLDTDKKTYNEYIKSNEYSDKIKELKKKNEITLEDRINLYKDIVDKDEITNDELEYLKNIPLLKIEDIKEKKYRAVYQIYNNNLKYYKEDLKALNNEIKRYFSNNKDKPTVYSCYLSIQNPLVVKGEDIGVSWQRYSVISSAIDEGYDGVIIIDGDTGAGLSNEYIVFNPNQIKSVNNNGNWSDSSNNINEAVAPKLNDNFWKWFGNSKVVDKDGQPQVCIHRTKADFDTFDISKSHPMNLQGKGFYFSTIDSKGLKQSFGENIKKCYLSIKNPFLGYGKKYPRSMFEKFVKKEYLDKIFGDKTEIMGYAFFFEMKMEGIGQTELDTTDILIKLGFDGIWLEDNDVWIAFYPNQIKSVDNNGNWSLTSDNINEWWSGGVNWQNDREGLGGVGATMDCHLFFFMFPDQFLNLCPKFSYGDDEFFNQYVADRKPMGIPFLWCNIDEEHKTIKVFDHEGRHRVKAIRSYAASRGKSQPDIPVAIIYNKDKYRLPVDLTELRKNWKIVSQKGDRTYNVGQFRVQNNLDNARIGLDNLYESIDVNVYHGSPNVFKKFDKEKLGTSTKKFEDGKYSSTDYGFFFTNDKEYASGYGENIYKCNIKLDNPLVVDMSDYIATEEVLSKFLQQAKNENKDGVIFKNIREVGRNPSTEYVVFNSDNIKILNKLTESSEPNLNQNFWNWFKGSKTVDEKGNPLIFYHGTKQPNITNFKAKYDDGLVFFAYNEEFAKEWASNAPLTPEQEQGVSDFKGSDDLANYRKEVMDRYKRDYGDNWADDDDIRKAAKWEIKEYEKQKYKQMGIEENVMPVYIRATKIFNPEKDYSKVIKEISDHWDLDLKSDYKQEYNEAKAEYDKVNNVINKWFEEHKEYRNDSAMEPEFRKREDVLTNALNKFNEVKKKIETRNNHLKRIMSGAWVYFENPETINKIWKLGYDAIELSEHNGVITTLAVREGTNQVKSIFNYGEWGSDTNIFENF